MRPIVVPPRTQTPPQHTEEADIEHAKHGGDAHGRTRHGGTQKRVSASGVGPGAGAPADAAARRPAAPDNP